MKKNHFYQISKTKAPVFSELVQMLHGRVSVNEDDIKDLIAETAAKWEKQGFLIRRGKSLGRNQSRARNEQDPFQVSVEHFDSISF